MNVLFHEQNSSFYLYLSPEKPKTSSFATMSIKMVKLVYESLDSMETVLRPSTMYAHRTHKIACLCVCLCLSAQIYSHPKRMLLLSTLKINEMANGKWPMEMRKRV